MESSFSEMRSSPASSESAFSMVDEDVSIVSEQCSIDSTTWVPSRAAVRAAACATALGAEPIPAELASLAESHPSVRALLDANAALASSLGHMRRLCERDPIAVAIQRVVRGHAARARPRGATRARAACSRARSRPARARDDRGAARARGTARVAAAWRRRARARARRRRAPRATRAARARARRARARAARAEAELAATRAEPRGCATTRPRARRRTRAALRAEELKRTTANAALAILRAELAKEAHDAPVAVVGRWLLSAMRKGARLSPALASVLTSGLKVELPGSEVRWAAHVGEKAKRRTHRATVREIRDDGKCSLEFDNIVIADGEKKGERTTGVCDARRAHRAIERRRRCFSGRRARARARRLSCG